MIQNELHTAFRWYDSLDKQNRFKSQCANVCDFKLLSPIGSLLPFQFDTGTDAITVDVWRIMCAADDTDMGGIPVDLLDIAILDTDYIIFNGLPEESETAYITECGSYYFQIETNQGIYYSEVFQAEEFTDPPFVQSELPIFTAWRWYDNVNLQNKFKSQCAALCDFYIITNYDKPLPFQFRIPLNETADIQQWILRNEDCQVDLDESLILKYDSEDYTYIYYLSEESPMTLTPLVLPNADFSTSESWVSIDETDANVEWDFSFNRGRFRATGSASESAVFSNQDIADGFLAISAGIAYQITYTIFSFSGPVGTYFAIRIGGTEGVHRTSAATYTETIIASEDGYVQLFAFKPTSGTDATITIDNIEISEAEPLPCGIFESVVTIDGVEYFSEWIKVLPTPEIVVGTEYLLQEDGFRLLQEDGFGILLE